MQILPAITMSLLILDLAAFPLSALDRMALKPMQMLVAGINKTVESI